MLNQNLLISRNQVWEKIDLLRAKGKPFEITVNFVKKDMTERRMVAKVGVKAGVSGEGLNWNPRERGMLNVHEVKNKSLQGLPAKAKKRIVTIDTLLNIKIDGAVYQVVDHLSDKQIDLFNASLLIARERRAEQKRFKQLQKKQQIGIQVSDSEVA